MKQILHGQVHTFCSERFMKQIRMCGKLETIPGYLLKRNFLLDFLHRYRPRTFLLHLPPARLTSLIVLPQNVIHSPNSFICFLRMEPTAVHLWLASLEGLMLTIRWIHLQLQYLRLCHLSRASLIFQTDALVNT